MLQTRVRLFVDACFHTRDQARTRGSIRPALIKDETRSPCFDLHTPCRGGCSWLEEKFIPKLRPRVSARTGRPPGDPPHWWPQKLTPPDPPSDYKSSIPGG